MVTTTVSTRATTLILSIAMQVQNTKTEARTHDELGTQLLLCDIGFGIGFIQVFGIID